MAVGVGAALLAFAIASFIPRHRPAGSVAHTSPGDGIEARAASAH
ncbi:hypothetical protein ACFWR9_40080 [Streptomyces sp. NPDC058534]